MKTANKTPLPAPAMARTIRDALRYERETAEDITHFDAVAGMHWQAIHAASDGQDLAALAYLDAVASLYRAIPRHGARLTLVHMGNGRDANRNTITRFMVLTPDASTVAGIRNLTRAFIRAGLLEPAAPHEEDVARYVGNFSEIIDTVYALLYPGALDIRVTTMYTGFDGR